jgi:hypothetical protein
MQRIISAASGPNSGELDRDRLAGDLLLAWNKWLTFQALDSDQGAAARKQLFARITETGRRFKKALLDRRGDYYVARQIASSFEKAADFETFLAGLERTIQAAEEAEKANKNGGWVRLPRSPREWLAVEILAPIYERNFGRSIKKSRGDRFIKFATAVMKEMGIPISEETVFRALKDARAGRARRRPRASTLTPVDAKRLADVVDHPPKKLTLPHDAKRRTK